MLKKRFLVLSGILLIIVTLTGILASIHKTIEVEIEANVEGVSFYVNERPGRMSPVRLITSPSATSIKLEGIEDIYITVNELFTCEDKQLIQDTNRLSIKKLEHSEDSSITFKKEGDGDLELESLQVTPHSMIKVSTIKHGNLVNIEIAAPNTKMNEKIGGKLSVGKPFRLLLRGYKIEVEEGNSLVEEGNSLKGSVEIPSQEWLQVIPTPQNILFQADSSTPLRVELSLSEEESLISPVFRKNIPIKKIKFIDDIGETTVVKGKIKFVGTQREPVNLDQFDYILFPPNKEFILRKFELHPRKISLRLVGATNKLRIGKTKDSIQNIIPSFLELISTNQLIICITGFITSALSVFFLFWEKMIGIRREERT